MTNKPEGVGAVTDEMVKRAHAILWPATEWPEGEHACRQLVRAALEAALSLPQTREATQGEAAWPTHSDGSNKTLGEMAPNERAAVMAAAKKRFFAPDFAGRMYPAKSGKIETIDILKEQINAGYQPADRASITRPVLLRVVNDLEHGIQVLDALQEARSAPSLPAAPVAETGVAASSVSRAGLVKMESSIVNIDGPVTAGAALAPSLDPATVEACAKVAERDGYSPAGWRIAAAIRALIPQQEGSDNG